MLKAFRLWRNKRTLHSLTSSEDDRAGAMFRLVETGDLRSVTIIVDWLIQSPTVSPRDLRTAATVLPRVNMRSALSRIEPFLDHPVRKRRAFEVLGYWGDAAESLLKPRVAKRDVLALEAYEQAMGAKAVPFLLHMARLSEFGGARCILQHGSEDDIDTILLLILNGCQMDLIQQVLGESFTPGTSTHQCIHAMFATSPDAPERSPKNFKEIPAGAIPFIAAAFTNADQTVQKRAADAIVAARPEAAEQMLVPLLTHRDRRLQEQAADILHRMEWEPASREERLRFCIAASNFESFVAEGTEAVPQLLKVIEHNPAAVADALGRIGDKRAVTKLIKLLGARDPLIQISAARALGRMQVMEGALELIQAIQLLQIRVERGENSDQVAPVYRELRAALDQCMPESPAAFLSESVQQIDAAAERLFAEAESNDAS